MRKMKSWVCKTLGMLFAFFWVLTVSAALVFAAADAYPSKPVRLIIPFAPGGSNDIIGRMIATKLTERLGKQVIVENRGGAGSVIGTEMVAKAAPDGYTLLIISSSYAINSGLTKLPFDPEKAFAPISQLSSAPMSLVVHPSVPATSVKELIALAKQKPGQLICSSSGVGSTSHLSAELFKIEAGIDFKIVQFKGGGPALTDQLGGHSQISLGSLVQVLPHIKSGALRILGNGGKKRSVILPHVPTIAEAGVPGYDATIWFGMLAPAGTPVPIIGRVSNELKAILSSDEVKNWFLAQGSEADYTGPNEFGTYLQREMIKWSRVVKEANIKVD